MSFSNRLYIVAVRGCLIAVAVALIAAPALGQDSDQPKRPVSQSTQQQPQVQPEPPKDEPGADFWKGKQGSPDTYRAICDKPKHQSDADLCQQWRVAEAGNQQAKWAFWQYIASAIGIGEILATIIYSHRATKAAFHAVDVAEQTLEASSGNSERQLRAYVSVVAAKMKVFTVGQPPEARVGVRNSGQTPAYKLKQWTALYYGPFPLASGGILRTDFEFSNSGVLGPGTDYTSFGRSDFVLTKAQAAHIRAGRTALWVYGEITYMDAFAKELRTTKFRLIYGGDAGASKDGMMIFTPDGNEAT